MKEKVKPPQSFPFPVPIPPRSKVEQIKADKRTSSWRENIGKQYRIGYYSQNDGLDVIWLVDKDGIYGETVDHEFLFKYFKIIRLSKETDFFGINRRRLGPLKKSATENKKLPKAYFFLHEE